MDINQRIAKNESDMNKLRDAIRQNEIDRSNLILALARLEGSQKTLNELAKEEVQDVPGN